MTAQPAGRIRASGPDTGPYEVIRLGGQDAVVLMLVYLTDVRGERVVIIQ